MGTAFSRPSTWISSDRTCHELGHLWSPSCVYSTAELFCFVYWEAIKIYFPLYLVSHVIRNPMVTDFKTRKAFQSILSSLTC